MDALPEDLIALILTHFTPNVIGKYARISHAFLNASRSENLWQLLYCRNIGKTKPDDQTWLEAFRDSMLMLSLVFASITQ